MRFYKTLNLLSIDVALGAVISAALFGRILHTRIFPQGFALLGITVWLIYTADHLLDAYSMKGTATSERHRFHQQNFVTLLITLIVAGAFAAGLLFVIRTQLITSGIFFGAFVILYLLISRWLKYFKELAGSLLYTGGVLLPAFSFHTQPLSKYQIAIIAVFGLIAFTNMIIFARFSIEEDILNRQKSLATVMGIRPMNNLISTTFVLCFGVMIYAATIDVTTELVMMFVMELILLIIFSVKYFRYYDRYRLYGDAIFIMPVVILPFLPSA